MAKTRVPTWCECKRGTKIRAWEPHRHPEPTTGKAVTPGSQPRSQPWGTLQAWRQAGLAEGPRSAPPLARECQQTSAVLSSRIQWHLSLLAGVPTESAWLVESNPSMVANRDDGHLLVLDSCVFEASRKERLPTFTGEGLMMSYGGPLTSHKPSKKHCP